jgi:hypothetical protein
MSGSWVASARKSVGTMVGMVGGASSTCAMVNASLQSSSSLHCISSYYSLVSSSLLLVLMAVVVQGSQKSANTNVILLHLIFYTQIKFTPSCIQMCTLKHLNTALRLGTTTVILVLIYMGICITCISDMALYLHWFTLHRLWLAGKLILYYNKFKILHHCPFFRGFSNTVPFF